MSTKNKAIKINKKKNSLQKYDFAKYFHFISEIIEAVSLGLNILLVKGNFVKD